MVAYTKPEQWKKEESERLQEERNKTKLIDFRFEREQIVRFWETERKARGSINWTSLE